MRMILHGLSYDIGNLGISAVIDLPHGMEYPSLHRLHAVNNMWYRSVKDHI